MVWKYITATINGNWCKHKCIWLTMNGVERASVYIWADGRSVATKLNQSMYFLSISKWPSAIDLIDKYRLYTHSNERNKENTPNTSHTFIYTVSEKKNKIIQSTNNASFQDEWLFLASLHSFFSTQYSVSFPLSLSVFYSH